METDRTDQYDDFRDELIRREWDTDGAPPECRICGDPIQWTGRGFLHVMPRTLAVPATTAEPGSIEYTAQQVARGFDLGDWIIRTSSHQATPS